jgi:hypothetical protein
MWLSGAGRVAADWNQGAIHQPAKGVLGEAAGTSGYIPLNREDPMPTSLPDDLAARVRRLSPSDQERALAYIRALERATSPTPLLALSGTIPPEDLTRIAAAIEADCERVDAAGW